MSIQRYIVTQLAVISEKLLLLCAQLNGERAKHADLVFAVNSGIIVGVYKPTIWYPSKVMEGRWEFEGEDIKDSPHLLMNISQYLGRRQNPVMYINM